ncbi:hypothetical protein [Pseudogracilibacillus sp. SO30301A]|uniref:hypothetical protein n=1 Tax=Pseudogracilibacillus sp. SO30301A TaxID=3098291 RepID=UPI00300E2588
MFVKVGYIGSKHSVNKTIELAKGISTIQLCTYTYELPADVQRLHNKAVRETDVICFSGIVPYYYRDRTIKTDKPIIITPFHEYMVTASLLTCLLHYSVQVNEISIDLPNKQVLTKIQNDIQFTIQNSFVYDYKWIYAEDTNMELSIDEIVAFHEELYCNKKTRMAITSIHYVYDKLIQKNIPAIYMVDNDRNMKQVLLDAKKTVNHLRLRDGLLSVMYVSIKDGKVLHDSAIQSVTSTIKSMIKMVTMDIKDKDTLAFYTTRGTIDERLFSVQDNKWIENLEKQLKQPISVGIGYGRHIFEAEENATLALQSAKKCKTSNGYIITEQKQMIGPIIGETTEEEIRTADDWMLELTEKTKTQMLTIIRFINFMRLNDYQPFSVKELAQYANINIRTAERFVKRLYEANVIILYGQEQIHHGRPRNVYALSEKIENKFRNEQEDK